MNCLHCAAETTNGLALCELCRAGASKYLEFIPVYFANLARWRPGRAGARDVPGSREPRLAGAPHDRVSHVLDEAGNALSTWARTLADDRGLTPPIADGEAAQVAVLARWLNENLTTIATLEWCGEFMREHYNKGFEGDGIGYHHDRLLSLTEKVVPGWYAGACHLCQTNTYVIPGLTWVTCGGCGVVTYARDHLEVVLVEARGWVARPKAIAETLVALLDSEQSVPRLHERIKKWGQRDKVTSIRRLDADGDEVGMKRYRLGEVLDVLHSEGQTRTSDTVTAAAS